MYNFDYGINYTSFLAILEDFSDAKQISDSNETKATSGYIFTLGGGVVAWRSTKQTVISKSNMKAEFFALDLTSNEAEWLRNLMVDVPIMPHLVLAIPLHCDS